MSTDSLQFKLRPSRVLAWVLVAVHAAALSLSCVAIAHAGLCSVIAVLVAASLWHAMRHVALRNAPSAIVEISLRSDGSAQLIRRDGRRDDARLDRSSFIAPWLALLVFQPSRWRIAQSILVLPDAVSSESFRALQVWLRWRRLTESA